MCTVDTHACLYTTYTPIISCFLLDIWILVTVQQFYNRGTSFPQSGLPMTPARILPNESPVHYGLDQSTNDILRSINLTISDVQMKLSSIEEKSRKYDEAFKHIEEALHLLQKS